MNAHNFSAAYPDLLDLGADPPRPKEDYMAVVVAIYKKDLSGCWSIRHMVPRHALDSGSSRVKRDARDIVVYLRGKGSVPDLETIWSMQHT